MNLNKIIYILCVICLSFQGQAQSLVKLKTEGLALFNAGQYRQAYALLKDFQLQKSDDWDVTRALGISAYYANDLATARQTLLTASENTTKADPPVFLHLGKTLHAQMAFKDAIKFYKEYLRRAKSDDVARRSVVADVKRCGAGIKLASQSELGLVENMGENVNSLHDEFAPIQSPNFEEKLYFSAAREDAEGGLRNDAGLEDLKTGRLRSDIYSTVFEGGDWTIPERLQNGLINSSRNEVLLDFVNAGKALLFFRGFTQYSGEILVDTFKADNEVRGLPPNFNSPVSAEIGDNSLTFFNDSIMIFASRQAGGFGGLDLYYTVYSDGVWRTPINMGNAVNSPYDETTPYLAKDGRTLYFASNSTASMGGFDIFKSTFNEDSLRFLSIENVGKPINSAGDDMYFRLSPDGMRGFFSSNRKESYGERDIYTVLFKSFQKEQTLSQPVAFHLVEEFKSRNPTPVDDKPKITEYTISPIFYEGDEDLLRGANLNQVKNLLSIVKQNPNLKIILTTHSVVGEKLTFDIYFGMKRTEKIAKYLIDNGLRNENILIKSVGSSYPIAKINLNGTPNPAGVKMNRRVDVGIANITTEPIKVISDAPIVSQFMVESVGEKLNIHYKGLSYKVQVQATKRIFDNDVLAKQGDAMMEAVGTEGVYQYTVGLFTDFVSAEKMRKDVQKEGFKDAFIVPFVDGVRLNNDDAKRFAVKYGDLKNYLASVKKP
jgi:outer membrane protein OmpA-like peptidoglycan-associated protein/tetratricopeptide (TPR) repeat protein